ncbi:hypothetical protein HPB50_027218 [Hyalomma asiaticum]|uniref:Uncharacterized protein n=1 Tax=Hyalomma asiaticum TaxID=266040 RepID=A0ACB7SJ11_HYAAI|nr:hypothetical protein HPB50_027218 [Hyalomma asiaticum]
MTRDITGLMTTSCFSENKKDKTLIESAIRQIEDNTCVKFVPYDYELRDYIYIVPLKGCYSYVGRVRGEQTVSLGKGCLYIGTIVHELLHALGFFHEHSRRDRDDYLQIFLNNVQPGFRNQFEKLHFYGRNMLTGFDYNSIMLYGSTAFAINAKSPSMLTKNGSRIIEAYQKGGLSNADIERIRLVYGCKDPAVH